MKLADLSKRDQHAFAGLIRLLLRSDGTVSDSERQHLAEVADDLGAEALWAAMDAVPEELPNDNAIKSAATDIAPAHREDIYAILVDLAIPDTIDPEEQNLLDWLARLWNITTATPDA